MPLSTRRYTELRFTISDLVQRDNWHDLFEICGTADDEQSKAISMIFSMYEPKRSWKLLDYVMKLPASERRSKRYSMRTVCYILGRMGQSDTKRAIKTLRILLSDDHMLREPVRAALSNLWVLDTKATSNLLLNWVTHSEDNDDLPEIAVRSSEYAAMQEPGKVEKFLRKVSKLDSYSKIASKDAASLIEAYLPVKNRQKAKKGSRK